MTSLSPPSPSTCEDALSVAGTAWQLFFHKGSMQQFSSCFSDFSEKFFLGIFTLWLVESTDTRPRNTEGSREFLAAHQSLTYWAFTVYFAYFTLNLRKNNSLTCCGWEEGSHEFLLRLPYLNELQTKQTKGMQSRPTRIINSTFADICLVHNWQNQKAVISIVLVGEIVFLLKLDICECF